jgi:hypothetical protein
VQVPLMVRYTAKAHGSPDVHHEARHTLLGEGSTTTVVVETRANQPTT